MNPRLFVVIKFMQVFTLLKKILDHCSFKKFWFCSNYSTDAVLWIRIRISLQMWSQNVWNMSLFEHFFKGLSLYLELGSGSGSASEWQVGSGSACTSDKTQDQDPRPDTHQSDADPQHSKSEPASKWCSPDCSCSGCLRGAVLRQWRHCGEAGAVQEGERVHLPREDPRPGHPAGDQGGQPGEQGDSQTVFRIHDILVWIRIGIPGSMPLMNGSGSCYFRHWPSRRQQKTNLEKKSFSTYYFLKVHLHHFSKIKSSKKAQNSRNQGFFTYFGFLIEGSISGSRAGSGSIPLTCGSGSGRPKNMWIRWIRIRI